MEQVKLSFSPSLFFLLYMEDSSFLLRHVIVPLLQEQADKDSSGSTIKMDEKWSELFFF